MKRILGLIAALALTTAGALAAPGPYPFAPPLTSPITQQAFNTTGGNPMTAQCGSSSFSSCPSGSIVGIVAQGMGNVSVQVTGTYTGTLQFESSLDCVNFTPLPLTPQGGTTTASTTTSTGLWGGSISAIYCVQVRFTAYTSGTANVTVSVAGGGGSVSATGSSITSSDPCFGQATYLSTQANVTASGNTQLIALSGGKRIFICHLGVQSNVGAIAVFLENGTGSACGTGTNQLSPTVNVATQYGWFEGSGGATIMSTSAGQAFCINLSGAVSSPGVGVYLEYVQQ